MFRLALALGMTVGELLERIDARELAEWKAYYELEPFGQDRGDVGSAMVCLVVSSALGVKDAKLQDFLPRFGEAETKPQGWEAMYAAAKAFAGRKQAEAGRRR